MNKVDTNVGSDMSSSFTTDCMNKDPGSSSTTNPGTVSSVPEVGESSDVSMSPVFRRSISRPSPKSTPRNLFTSPTPSPSHGCEISSINLNARNFSNNNKRELDSVNNQDESQ